MVIKNSNLQTALSRLRIGSLALLVLAAMLGGACGTAPSEEESPQDPGVRSTGLSHLGDLPDEILSVTALETIAGILPAAQLEVIDYFIKDEHTDAVTETMLADHKEFLEAADKEATPRFAAHRLEALGISLVDPRPLDDRLAQAHLEIKAEACLGMKLLEATQAEASAASERHNLIVFYVRNVLKLCGDAVDWQPDTAENLGISTFYELFADGHYYKNLDAYLEDFRNQPFTQNHNLFMAIYFQYLRLAFQARSIDFPRREFVDRRLDLRQSYPELRYLSEYFAVMVRAGIAS